MFGNMLFTQSQELEMEILSFCRWEMTSFDTPFTQVLNNTIITIQT